MRWRRRHSSTPPPAVVRGDTVQVVPLDDERALVHPRADEVRFHGASPPFGPLRATVVQPGDLRAGGAMPAYASQRVHTGGTAPFAAYRAAQHAFATPDGTHWRGGRSVLLKIARSTSGQSGSLAPQRVLNTILVLFGYSPRDLDTREGSRRASVRCQKNMLFATATWMLLLLMSFVDGAMAEQKLTASDAASGDQFGHTVSVSGEYAVVGAVNDNSGEGSAYIFVRSGTTWTQNQRLTASDASAGHKFGSSVSVSGDYAVVGAYGDNSREGSAYVFVHSGSAWTQQQKLTASDAASGDQFGYSVSVSGDYVVVGASVDGPAGSTRESAYVFVRSGTTWTQQQKLAASDAAWSDYFGFSVSVSGDYAVVGAWGDNSAYIFVRSGTAWTQQQKLTALTSDARRFTGITEIDPEG